MADSFASPGISSPTDPEIVRPRDELPPGMKPPVKVAADFSGGWFVCCTCQNTFLLDAIDMEHFKRIGGSTEFYPVCHQCQGFAASIGFSVWAHLSMTGPGFRFRLMVLALTLFGIKMTPNGPRRLVEMRDDQNPLLVGRSEPENSEKPTEAKG